jgi:transposase
MAEATKLIRRHVPNVLTYLQHGITNADLEAVNALIQCATETAQAFRNPRTSRSPSTFTVEAWISIHTKVGRCKIK